MEYRAISSRTRHYKGWAALFVRVMNIDTAGAGDRPPVFSDMAGHWAFKEIEAAAEAGLVKGTADSLFEPDKALTREQMVVLLDRIFGAKTPAQGAPAAEVFLAMLRQGRCHGLSMPSTGWRRRAWSAASPTGCSALEIS